MKDNLANFKKKNGHDDTATIVKEITEQSKLAPISRTDFLLDYFCTWTQTKLDGCNLNLGCGAKQRIPGFSNLDRCDYPNPVDYVVDLEDGKLPMLDNTYDFVLASHVLEHIRNFIPLMRELHRVIAPGGFVGVCCPYASSNDAWEDPTHVRAFTENSWMYLDCRTYTEGDHAGLYNSGVDFIFELVRIDLQPSPLGVSMIQRIGPDKFQQCILQYRNMVQEMFVTLKVVK